MTSRYVLILGAGSDIGIALAREYAENGDEIVLAARNVDQLAADAEDLKCRYGATASLLSFDVLDCNSHVFLAKGLSRTPDLVICVIGLLGNQMRAQADAAEAELIMRTNYVGPSLILNTLAAEMEVRGSGTIVGISSVAGDRGRASNYIYGSAKAGFTAFLSGLRNRLAGKGVHVMTVKPGFVNTRMTFGMSLPKALTAEPREVARAIRNAEIAKRNVVYIYARWWLVMTVIRMLPESVFKKTKM